MAPSLLTFHRKPHGHIAKHERHRLAVKHAIIQIYETDRQTATSFPFFLGGRPLPVASAFFLGRPELAPDEVHDASLREIRGPTTA